MAELTTIPTRKLTEEQAVIKTAATQLHPWRESVADGLTPAKLGRIMRDVDHGDPYAYLVLAEEMGEREPHYASVLQTRTLGVSGSERGVVAPDDSADAKTIADDVEQTIVQKPEFEGLMVDLMSAVQFGFSCVEIMWARDLRRWEPTAYLFREQRYFTFDRDTYRVPLLLTDASPNDGEPLQPYKWLTHFPKIKAGVPLRTGISRTVAVCYAAKRWSVADWMAFLDQYGMPLKLGRYPQSMASRANELLTALKKLATDSTAVVPVEMMVELIESKVSGGSTTPHQQSAEYWDKQTSKVVLGQTMTTDDGASLSQSVTHERVRFDIRKADARQLCACADRYLIRPFVDLNYGPQKAYPSLYIHCEQPEDTERVMRTAKLFVDMGGRIQESEARDRIGFAEPEEGADLLQPAARLIADMKPKPDDEATDTEGGDAKQGEGADGDDEVESDGKSPAELNRQQFAETEGTEDIADTIAAAQLGDWKPLLEGNVGRLLREIANAKTFEEARALLLELAADDGEVIDIAALTVSLARQTFRARGVGDATDRTEV